MEIVIHIRLHEITKNVIHSVNTSREILLLHSYISTSYVYDGFFRRYKNIF